MDINTVREIMAMLAKTFHDQAITGSWAVLFWALYAQRQVQNLENHIFDLLSLAIQRIQPHDLDVCVTGHQGKHVFWDDLMLKFLGDYKRRQSSGHQSCTYDHPTRKGIEFDAIFITGTLRYATLNFGDFEVNVLLPSALISHYEDAVEMGDRDGKDDDFKLQILQTVEALMDRIDPMMITTSTIASRRDTSPSGFDFSPIPLRAGLGRAISFTDLSSPDNSPYASPLGAQSPHSPRSGYSSVAKTLFK